jgi:hypothetical protein
MPRQRQVCQHGRQLHVHVQARLHGRRQELHGIRWVFKRSVLGRIKKLYAVDQCAPRPADPCKTAGCSADATCTPSGDTATCRCKDGYAGDGRTCTLSNGGGECVATAAAASARPPELLSALSVWLIAETRNTQALVLLGS